MCVEQNMNSDRIGGICRLVYSVEYARCVSSRT